MDRDTPAADVTRVVRAWVDGAVPAAWRDAAPGGRAAIRAVRQPGRLRGLVPDVRGDGLVVGPGRSVRRVDLAPAQARAAEAELAPYNLGTPQPARAQQCGARPVRVRGPRRSAAVFAADRGQRQRWCQLLSEPGRARTSRGSRPARCATARSRSRRSEGVDHVGARVETSRLSGPDRRRCPSARASRTSWSTSTRRASPCGRASPRRRDRLRRGLPRRLARARRPAGRARPGEGSRVAARRSRASGRWSRAGARVASTGSGAPASTGCCGGRPSSAHR